MTLEEGLGSGGGTGGIRGWIGVGEVRSRDEIKGQMLQARSPSGSNDAVSQKSNYLLVFFLMNITFTDIIFWLFFSL